MSLNGLLGHDSATARLYWACWQPWLMRSTNFNMNHAPGAGSTNQPQPAVQCDATVPRLPHCIHSEHIKNQDTPQKILPLVT